MSSENQEIALAQQYVSMLYRRLDDLRARASGELARVRRDSGGTRQHLVERDVAARTLGGRIVQLDAAEQGLCFGRLDLDGGERRHIGRIGILDPAADYEPLLIDWRAPAARPFYVATSAAPLGVRRRRHIRTRMRTVIGLDDDALGEGSLGDGAGDPDGELVGEAALLAALTAERTGRMRDVVETIQAEQDAVIRDRMSGILVVQGGPGTGKTAVALHRAAYLLYTYREQLSRRGVLIVGPNTTFLRYISHVLPALGETGAVLLTVGELFPGVAARRGETSQVAEIKGRAVMAEVLAAAVRARQRMPRDARAIVIDGVSYRLDRETCLRAQEKARAADDQHNLARTVFVDSVMEALVDQVVEHLTRDPFEELTAGLVAAIEQDLKAQGLELEDVDDEERGLFAKPDRDEVRRSLGQEPAVHEALDELWPELTPQQLLDELFATPALLDEAAPQLDAAERAALWREPGGEWTVADVPLLDEAAELLGAADQTAAAEELRRQREIAYAQGVLEVMSGSRSIDLEDEREWDNMVTAADLLDAETLADWQAERDTRTVAERAAADRTWTFGHVIVDEAQELSAMAWRLLMRRCPARSMTLVGDVAQTGSPAGAASWDAMLAPFAGGRWRAAELTVNYRTPKEVMAVAARVLARIDPSLKPPRSVRESGIEPRRETVPAALFARRLGEIAREQDAAVGDGRLAVIVPVSRAGELAAAVAGAVPEAAFGDDPDLEQRTTVLTVRQAKGLEFDTVVLADPDAVTADGPRGDNDLYVALTRATKRLVVLAVEQAE